MPEVRIHAPVPFSHFLAATVVKTVHDSGRQQDIKKGGTVEHFHDLETDMVALAEKHLRCAIKNLPEKHLAVPTSAGEAFLDGHHRRLVCSRCQVKSGKVFEEEVPAWMHPGQWGCLLPARLTCKDPALPKLYGQV